MHLPVATALKIAPSSRRRPVPPGATVFLEKPSMIRSANRAKDPVCAEMTMPIVGDEVALESTKKAGQQLYCSGNIQNKLLMYGQVEFTRMAT